MISNNPKQNQEKDLDTKSNELSNDQAEVDNLANKDELTNTPNTNLKVRRSLIDPLSSKMPFQVSSDRNKQLS